MIYEPLVLDGDHDVGTDVGWGLRQTMGLGGNGGRMRLSMLFPLIFLLMISVICHNERYPAVRRRRRERQWNSGPRERRQYHEMQRKQGSLFRHHDRREPNSENLTWGPRRGGGTRTRNRTRFHTSCQNSMGSALLSAVLRGREQLRQLWLKDCFVGTAFSAERSRSPSFSDDQLDMRLFQKASAATADYKHISDDAPEQQATQRGLQRYTSSDQAPSMNVQVPSMSEKEIARGKIAGDTFVNKKAGMDGVNASHVAMVVEEMTRGTPFYENEQKREKTRQKRLADALKKVSKLDSCDWQRIRRRVSDTVERLEERRKKEPIRIFAVIDMDAFFAMVEERSNPSLRGVPFAVGGLSMLATTNYEARKYGVRSAMPGFIALRLCPQLKFIGANFNKYSAASAEVRTILRDFDPVFTMYSLDEAYLDLTPRILKRLSRWCRLDEMEQSDADQEDSDLESVLNGDSSIFLPAADSPLLLNFAEQIAQELRERIIRETNLTGSVGVASVRFVAKMVADKNKPNGQYIVPFDQTLEFVRRQPVRKIGGIGKATEKVLAGINITTVQDMWDKRVMLRALCEALTWYERFDFFLSIAMGLDYKPSSGMGPQRGLPPTPNNCGTRNPHSSAGSGSFPSQPTLAVPPRRAIGCERTFQATSNKQILRHRLMIICRDLAADIVRERNKSRKRGAMFQCEEDVRPGRCVALKIKFDTFEAVTRSHRQPRYLSTKDELFEAASQILEEEWKRRRGFRARLLGVRLSEFTPANQPRLEELLRNCTFTANTVNSSGSGGAITPSIQLSNKANESCLSKMGFRNIDAVPQEMEVSSNSYDEELNYVSSVPQHNQPFHTDENCTGDHFPTKTAPRMAGELHNATSEEFLRLESVDPRFSLESMFS